GHQIIGYKTDDSNQNHGFQAVNPATGKPIAEYTFFNASETQMDQAIELADQAFRLYKQTSAQVRAHFLRAIADEIDQRGELLTITAGAETGLPAGRLNGERGRTIGQLRMFADWIEEGSY